MDYNTEKIAKVVNLYLMLMYNDVSYIRNEVGKFLKNELLPILNYKVEEDDDEEDDEDEDKEEKEASEVSDLTRELSKDCQSIAYDTARLKGKNDRFDVILKEIKTTADGVSNYNDKPLVSQLVCLWYIFTIGKNEHQEKVIDLLKNEWKIKDVIFAEMADTYATLTELKENSQKVAGYAPKKSFFLKLKELFKKNKIPEKKMLFDDEYKNNEQILLQSIVELFATEAVKD
ncbi:MAG: hypothetical protein LBH44_01930 [Treponema sp.]|jgi:predicted protein tyrosine phosphatase|nr:hypothetical protein [Treponema sp.]